MSKVYKSFTELVGNTPLMELCNLKKDCGFLGNIFAKLEFFNPAGSIKDRVALSMVLDAEQKGMSGAIEKAEQLNKEIKGSIIAGQFYNPSNPQAHYETTGPEIYEALDGKVDLLVCGVGTGGTLSGTGKFLKEQNPDIKVIAVEPQSSPVLSENVSGPHKIQGIGANFVPENLDRSIYDRIITVSDEDAFEFARKICKTEGLCVGISAGAALCAAMSVANEQQNRDKNIVVILPDTGSRYLSTDLF